MAYNTRLTIPRVYHSAMTRLISLSEPEYVALQQSLADAVPSLYRGDIVSFVAGRVPLDKDVVEEIVQLLLIFYRVRATRKVDVPKFVDDVFQAMQTVQEDGKPELNLNDATQEIFKVRLDHLMRLEKSLGITSKAFDVMSEHGRVYYNPGTRVLTDIRPVFSDDLEVPPSAAVIVHTLKIVYHEDDEHKDFFVALDINDVRELRELLDRADKKDQALQVILKKTPMQYLDPEIHP